MQHHHTHIILFIAGWNKICSPTAPKHVIPHICDATQSHAYHLVHSCLKYIKLTHRANTRYSSCHSYSYTFLLFASLRANTSFINKTYIYIIILPLPLPRSYPHTYLPYVVSFTNAYSYMCTLHIVLRVPIYLLNTMYIYIYIYAFPL